MVAIFFGGQMTSRAAAVAGIFYPAGPGALRAAVRAMLADAHREASRPIKALIVPHAGFEYSGPVAATAYAVLGVVRERIRRVVLLGPAHRLPVHGMAFPSVDAFDTPLGSTRLDTAAIERALSLPRTCVSDEAHAFEHCLEVQLPFLEELLDAFVLVPFLVGDCPTHAVAAVLELLWGGDETLIVVSSDLSHYLPYAAARARDAATSRAIAARAETLSDADACGARAINALMHVARAHDLRVTVLDVRNSGDTAGDRDRVVGYGAYVIG